MRRAANVDANQAAIVKALESMGCTVMRLSGVGNSCPDLLVGCAGVNILLEVKNADRKGGRENAHGTLRKQREWREKWRGSVYTVTSPADAEADVRRAVAVLGEA